MSFEIRTFYILSLNFYPNRYRKIPDAAMLVIYFGKLLKFISI
jgi:hypothetical protein